MNGKSAVNLAPAAHRFRPRRRAPGHLGPLQDASGIGKKVDLQVFAAIRSQIALTNFQRLNDAVSHHGRPRNGKTPVYRHFSREYLVK
jgi:hypothetical protein